MPHAIFAWHMLNAKKVELMASKVSGDDGETIAEINVIPLVDIILVVLIIFMVAAPLVMQPKIDINLPKAASGNDTKEPASLKVTMGKNGELYLNDKQVSLEDIHAEAKKAAATNPEIPCILVADKDVTLEKITELVDAVKTGGLRKVAFSIQKK